MLDQDIEMRVMFSFIFLVSFYSIHPLLISQSYNPGILESKLLQEFLALVLVTGNYMNSVSWFEN